MTAQPFADIKLAQFRLGTSPEIGAAFPPSFPKDQLLWRGALYHRTRGTDQAGH